MSTDDAFVPPWKRLYRDIASNGPLRRCGLEGAAVFMLLLAVCDTQGRIPGAIGDTVAQTVGAAIGWPASEVERPVATLLQRGLLQPWGASGVRFCPRSWARRQRFDVADVPPLHALADDARGALPHPSPALDAAPPPAFPARARAESTAAPRGHAKSSTERVDRMRYREVAEGHPATGRHAAFAHPTGMPFEAWLSTADNGVQFLQHRRKDNPAYATGVTPALAVTPPLPPPSGNVTRALPDDRVTAGNALPVRTVGMVSPAETEKPVSQTTEGNVTAVGRVTLPGTLDGVTRVTPNVAETVSVDLPELPSLPSVDDPRIATGQRLTEGHRALRALIDRANAERRGAVLELGASADAMRYAALALQTAGVKAHGDAMEPGVRMLDALVSLLRSPEAMRRVLGKWQRVKECGYALPLNICARNEGQAMQQLIAEASKVVRNRSLQGPCLPLAMPLSAAPPIDGDAIVYEFDRDGEIVERERISGDGVRRA